MRFVRMLLVFAAACAPTSDPDNRAGDVSAAPTSTTNDARPESSCVGSDNPIDVAACPRLASDGCASAPGASTFELCRRLFVDLTGAAPTPDEIATTCAGKDARTIASALMTSPAFVKHTQELWGERLGYDPAQVDGAWLADADLLVASLARGELGYDAFTRRIVGHPVLGVGARLPRSDVLEDDDRFYPQVAHKAFTLFLGRAPVAGEEDAYAKLFRFWKKQIRVLNGDYGRAEVWVDPSVCPCETTLFGQFTSVTPPLDAIAPYTELATDPPTPMRAELDKIGALLETQDAYWTQGADLALGMYLGWWKTTSNVDASLLAEVDDALGARLRASRSWPELVLDVVTSTLYVRSNRVASGARDDLPVWCAGPFRVMRPEAYVASLGKLLGVRVGRCDHRTWERRGNFYPDGSEGTFFPDALREDEPSDASAFGVDDYHWVASTGMGGCSGGAARSEDPTLPMVFGAAPAAADVCGASRTLVPSSIAARDVSDATVRAIADRLSPILLGRAPTDAERAAMASDAAACAGDASCTSNGIATSMCAAMARSIDALSY